MRLFHRQIEAWRYVRFMRTGHAKLVTCNLTPTPVSEPVLDVVSIAFNNPNVIREQIRLLAKHLRDPYCLAVADNSSRSAARREILAVCRARGVAYIGLPPGRFAPSMSHGTALNWMLRHYLHPRAASYFGFLDHDIYPVRPTRIIPILTEQPVYGHLQERDERWYLWAGFCFFNRAGIGGGDQLDFRPAHGNDTGGRNGDRLYAGLDRARLIFPKSEYGRLRDGDVPQADWYETIGDWLHTFNASYWLPVADKEDAVQALLRQY